MDRERKKKGEEREELRERRDIERERGGRGKRIIKREKR